MNSSFSAKGV
jgi:predicted ATP-binding protein involved in virulence